VLFQQIQYWMPARRRKNGAKRVATAYNRTIRCMSRSAIMTCVRVIARQCRFAVFVTVLCFATALGAQAPVWRSYSYPADGFSASFPSAPDVQKRNVSTDAGPFELRSYVVQDGDVAMFVGVCDYGAQAAGKDPDVLLRGAKDGALKNSSSHLVSEKKITIGIYDGLEFEAETDQAHFTARVYMVGTTLYQTLVVSNLGKPYADTMRFLDSFQLIARTSS
jgi:hypothetical protein